LRPAAAIKDLTDLYLAIRLDVLEECTRISVYIPIVTSVLACDLLLSVRNREIPGSNIPLLVFP
jgi:hypothetical protein